MKSQRVALLAALWLAVSPMVLPAGAVSAEVVSGGVSAQEEPPEASYDEILVKFRPETTPTQRVATIASINGKVEDEATALGVLRVRTEEGQAREALKQISGRPEVERAEPNYIYSVAIIPNDTRFGRQWGLHNTGQTIDGVVGLVDADIDAPQAWDTTRGSSGVRIAILDTGIFAGHTDLSGKVVQVRNFSSSATSADIRGHGTHVAGTAAARFNNNFGVAGVCPNCTLLNVKVLGDDGNGDAFAAIRGVLFASNCEGIFCGEPRARVINMSFGGPGNSVFLEAAINLARGNRVILTCAAGNDNTNQAFFPAAFGNCISVSATTNRDQRATFSNFGATVDVAAPGEDILSTSRTGGFEFRRGTSMAAPHVAGLAGLLFSQGLSANTVRSRIENRTDAIAGGGGSTRGRINACKAVRNIAAC